MTLDTRSKIYTPDRLPELAGDALFVAMFLDPLTAAHAARLAELAAAGRPVAVLLFDPPEPLLALAARAELAASLAMVTAVIPVTGDLPSGLAVVDERAVDLERRQVLVDHVFARHAMAAAG